MTQAEWQRKDWKREWSADKVCDAVSLWGIFALLAQNAAWTKWFVLICAIGGSVRWLLFKVMDWLSCSAEASRNG